MSAYNNETEQNPHSNRCSASGCPMIASLSIDGSPWACRYHVRQPVNIWLKITELLKQNKRWFNIIKSADSISAHQYDAIQKANTWELDDLIKPVEGENHKHWVLRTKETIYKALMYKINQIAEVNEISVSGAKNSSSIRQLTSGVLLKKK